MQIVIARLDEDTMIAEYGQLDIGRPHKFKSVPKPIAAMWLSEGGDETDLEKCRAYVRKINDGWKVFTYPQTERDPLGAAKRDVAA